MNELFDDWLIEVGQCLVCGGRGGSMNLVTFSACERCDGTGRDPQRDTSWYQKVCVPAQLEAIEEQRRRNR